MTWYLGETEEESGVVNIVQRGDYRKLTVNKARYLEYCKAFRVLSSATLPSASHCNSDELRHFCCKLHNRNRMNNSTGLHSLS